MDAETIESIDLILSFSSNIPSILDTQRRNEILQSLQEICVSYLAIDQSIELFHSLTKDESKQFILDNICVNLTSRWNELLENVEILEQIRSFIYSTCVQNFKSYSFDIQKLIGKVQVIYAMNTFPEIWPNLFEETFFDTDHIEIAINFIYCLCNLIYNVHFFRLSTYTQFINTLNSYDITTAMFNLITHGLTLKIPLSFATLGFFTVIFRNEWISSNDYINVLTDNLLDQDLQPYILESLRYVLKSSIPLETKQKLYTEDFQIFNLLPQLTKTESIIQASYLIYNLVLLNQKDMEFLGSITESLIIPYFQCNDEIIIYNIASSLHSIILKDPESYIRPVASAAIACLNEINHMISYITPPKHVWAILNLIEQCFVANLMATAETFDEFLNTNFSSPLEDICIDSLCFQVLRIYRATTLKYKVVNMYTRYNDFINSYNNMLNPETWGSAIDETQQLLFTTYFATVLTIPTFYSSEQISKLFISCATILINISETKCDAFYATSNLLLAFTNKCGHQIVADDAEHKMIFGLLRTLDHYLCSIAVHIIESKENMMANQPDILCSCLPALSAVFQIENENIRIESILSAISFLSSRNNPIDRPDISSQIAAFLMKCVEVSGENDRVIGNILSYLPKIGDIGFELYQVLSNRELVLCTLKGCATALMQFYEVSVKDIDNLLKLKQIVLSEDFINETFSQMTNSLINSLLPEYESCNPAIIDQNDAKEAISRYIDCGSKFIKYLHQDIAQIFIEFVQNFVTKHDTINSVFNSICSFIQNVISHPIEFFDPFSLLENLHSFLISPGIDPNKGFVLPISYYSMMAAACKANFESLQQVLTNVLQPFGEIADIVEFYLSCFKTAEDFSKLPSVFEMLISIRGNLFL
ncbi:hypothetical protein TVAG_190080 [Trichomonas vaginalis G3]|uniref:Exportin-T n=1 Tax=Trichomonas vaginalis (strain ATCC PRA-98 / G3) TaxID=412133 RepID=A2DKD9_TRIV3|nr:armadillo (ARM) repeat-containing protein family [Trichomonas vaginalis G3]EAY19116.1 hypothetical protein TVAG_190080 [Trichomonas vaginalis G3]KAI5490414.1 armadillo (ARM) repeat-containing protein family [Trichomonas vaginalis G3]|eukprot:XP_001580102.1 hypothetical protein [Trichomonas vaginalis G3]